MRRYVAMCWVAAWTSLVGGCEPERPFTTTPSVRDSLGVRIVETSQPQWTDGETWRVDGNAEVVIGAGDAGDLHDVAGAARLSDGRIVVANGGSSEVRFYRRDGFPEIAVGGEGEGPGEFLLLQSLGSGPGDTVWAYDFALQRFTFFRPDGEMVRAATLEPRLPAGVPAGRLVDGSFVMAQLWGSGGPTPQMSEGLVRELAAYVRYDERGVLIDTVGRFPGREVLLWLERGRAVMGTVPFARTASHTVVDDGFVVGGQEGYELVEYHADGSARSRIRWQGPSLEVSDSELADWKDLQVASASPDERASVRSYLADVPVGDLKPAYGTLLSDSEGCLWISAYDHLSRDAIRWDVVDAEGGWLGPVDMPPRFRPLQIGPDWVLGVARDELGVERVELRALHR